MRISESKIEQIRSSASIVDIISEYVPLRSRGKNFIGLCPFHNEKTPSFTVSEEKQIYHCFGCHAGGNVYKFLMDYLKISFIESVQELAAKLGITLEYDESNFTEKQSEQEILYDINSAAGRFFSDNLLNSKEGETAFHYFEERKIKPKTMREFGLGYALPDRDSFISFAQSKKIDLEKALYLGLIGRNNDGRLFDKFAGRIIFPIFSPNGRVVAFAGRILDNREGTAKYLNSPESQIYFKSRILYGLSHAKDEIRRLDKAIIVEGYMDLISLYQAGIKNVVAVSGTALTDEQAQLLSRYTKNVVLLFDADTAGIKASMRSIEILLKKDIEIKIASLPGGEDPDSFVNNYGREKFEDLITAAQNFLEYQSAYYERLGMFGDPAKLTEAVRELVKPVALINDELKRSILLKTISKKFNLREKLLESELDKITARNQKQAAVIQAAKSSRQPELKSAVPNALNTAEYFTERDIIKLLFEGNREIVELIYHHIQPHDFYYEAHAKIAEKVYESFNKEEELVAANLIEKLEEEVLRSYIFEITLDKYKVSKRLDEMNPVDERKNIIKLAVDAVKKFKINLLNKQIVENSKRIESIENEEERFEILKMNKEIEREKMLIAEELDNLYSGMKI